MVCRVVCFESYRIRKVECCTVVFILREKRDVISRKVPPTRPQGLVAGLVGLEVVTDADDEVMRVIVCRHINPSSSQEITVA
jgi:hypothetical protein